MFFNLVAFKILQFLEVIVKLNFENVRQLPIIGCYLLPWGLSIPVAFSYAVSEVHMPRFAVFLLESCLSCI